MSGQKLVNDNRSRYEEAYHDTLFFINAIAKDYDFYDDLFESIKEGSTQIAVKKREIKKTIDESWVSVIEESLPSLDMCIRKPGKRIEEVEEILPIELSRSITVRSMQHLSQHTNLISKVEGDTVTPSKILNVYRDESLDTYENKFLNTLILRLYLFIDRRYAQLKESGMSTISSTLEFSSSFTNGLTKGKFNFRIEMEEDTEHNENTLIGSLMSRIERLHNISNQYVTSDFVAQMGKSYVHPPIMRTNAITKNKDLRQCLILWQFIESYENIGCEINVQEAAEIPNEEYIEQLYSMLALQYVVFRYNVSDNFDDAKTLFKKRTNKPILPKFITELDEFNDVEFDVNDMEYRKVVPSIAGTAFTRSRLSLDDKELREAIDLALDVDAELTRLRVAKERKAAKLAADRRKARLQKMAKKQREQKKRALEREKAKNMTGKKTSSVVTGSNTRKRRKNVIINNTKEQ